jgi:transposase
MNIGQEVVVGSVVGGVDTHKDLHVAAVVDGYDRTLGSRCFPTTRQGYKQMLAWMQSFGPLLRLGIESTGTYGAGLLRYMQNAGVEVLEVTIPDIHDRRRRGKSDDLDAQNAAHAAFTGKRTVTPKSRDGMIESLRVLKACRKTAVAARRVALQMIQNTIISAPDELREMLRKMTRMQLVRTLAAWRPDLTDYRNLVSAYKITLKSLARRYLELHDEIADLDTMIIAIVDELAPTLISQNSIGHGSAAQLLLTAGDNSERLHSEASFAALCGASPVSASSGKTNRHRLNRGGDRAANSALHIIALGRLRTDPRTKAYMTKRTAEGHSKLEVIRCLKRYIAREVFTLISQRRREINQASPA